MTKKTEYLVVFVKPFMIMTITSSSGSTSREDMLFCSVPTAVMYEHGETSLMIDDQSIMIDQQSTSTLTFFGQSKKKYRDAQLFAIVCFSF